MNFGAPGEIASGPAAPWPRSRSARPAGDQIAGGDLSNSSCCLSAIRILGWAVISRGALNRNRLPGPSEADLAKFSSNVSLSAAGAIVARLAINVSSSKLS